MKLDKYHDIKKVLIQKKLSLLKADKNIAKDLQNDFDERHGDSADIAESIQEQELAISLKAKAQDELRDIEEALGRIEKGEYGLCAECDEEILKKRLSIQPYSIYCVACQEERELAKS